jgi:hypothetical protein
MTAADVITRIRRILKDDFEPYRFSSSYLLDALSDAQQELGRLRPDLLATTAFALTTLTDLSSTATTLAYGVDMREALAYLTCEQIYLTENADDGNQAMAVVMRRKFEEAMLK